MSLLFGLLLSLGGLGWPEAKATSPKKRREKTSKQQMNEANGAAPINHKGRNEMKANGIGLNEVDEFVGYGAEPIYRAPIPLQQITPFFVFVSCCLLFLCLY